jgi:RNA polymerase sigma factor (sigma-70 family)
MAIDVERMGKRRVDALPPFQVFVEAHRGAVYRFLVAAAGPEDADDCFQETFLAALRAYPQLRTGDNLRGWILTIASHKVIDGHRSRARRRPVELTGELAGSIPDDAVGDGPPVADPTEPLWTAVRSLPTRQRVAVALRFVVDRSYADIATFMGSTEATARANVSLGLRTLRKRWAEADTREEGMEDASD